MAKNAEISRVSDDFREPGTFEKTTHENTMRAALSSGFTERANPLEISRYLVGVLSLAYKIPRICPVPLFWASSFYFLLKDWETALKHCDEAGRIVHERGMMEVSGYMRGVPLARLGQPEAGLAQMLPFKNTIGALPGSRGRFFWKLADIYLVMGREREGMAAVDQALEFTRGEFDAELRRLKGELLLLGEGRASAEAEHWFRDAIEIARKQSAKSLELRATMSLARLLEKLGDREQARTMLAEIFNWFTEGLDTPDLKEAKSLLDGIRAIPSAIRTS